MFSDKKYDGHDVVEKLPPIVGTTTKAASKGPAPATTPFPSKVKDVEITQEHHGSRILFTKFYNVFFE